jgi:predicted small integral membrane protein
MFLSWMAWTWPTALFFIGIFASIAAMGVWEYYSPGGDPRHGVFGLDTTRGDRLFIIGTALWGGAIVCVLWAIFIFRYV